MTSCVGIDHICVLDGDHLIIVVGDGFRIRRLDNKTIVRAGFIYRALHYSTPNLGVHRNVGENHDTIASTLGLTQGALQPL